MQLDLFDDRHVILDQARTALAELRLADARRSLVQLSERYPADPAIAEELARVQRLFLRWSDLDVVSAAELAPASLKLARDVEARGLGLAVRAALLRRVGEALGMARGDHALLDGQPPGFYFLVAGDSSAARASLLRAIDRQPRARFFALLGDGEHGLGQGARARSLYLEALLHDPFDAAIELVVDEEVRTLPDLARNEMGLDEPVAWAAAVGAVTGVLPVRRTTERPLPDSDDGALARARAFVDALGRTAAGAGSGIAARKEMKRLAPGLFAAYVERLAGGRAALV